MKKKEIEKEKFNGLQLVVPPVWYKQALKTYSKAIANGEIRVVKSKKVNPTKNNGLNGLSYNRIIVDKDSY